MKRPLTDVTEEPQEKDDDSEVTDGLQAEPNNSRKFHLFIPASLLFCNNLRTHATTVYVNLIQADCLPDRIGIEEKGFRCHYFPVEYDLANEFPCDTERSEQDHGTKRHRAEEHPFNNLTSRFGSHYQSLSRKWNNRWAGSSTSVSDSLQDAITPRSRANSTRAPSLVDFIGNCGDCGDYPYPPTPARSVHEDSRDDAPVSPIDIRKANAPLVSDEEVAEDLATTPLLPPLLIQFASKAFDEPAQSPLQSPTVAESPSAAHVPTEAPRFNGLPSPPLSTRPSIASFQHRQFLPNSENPQIELSDPHDEWSKKLGHANFTIYPEPYLPTTLVLSSCNQLRADWDAARLNFTKHLARTGEYYSTTSRIHQLTEEKWAEIDTQWKRNNELAIANTPDYPGESVAVSKQVTSVDVVPLIKLPSLNGPRSAGKFPQLGDQGIVGPMVREKKTPLQQRPNKKRGFWKFLQGVLPSSVAFGRGQA